MSERMNKGREAERPLFWNLFAHNKHLKQHTTVARKGGTQGKKARKKKARKKNKSIIELVVFLDMNEVTDRPSRKNLPWRTSLPGHFERVSCRPPARLFGTLQRSRSDLPRLHPRDRCRRPRLCRPRAVLPETKTEEEEEEKGDDPLLQSRKSGGLSASERPTLTPTVGSLE